MSDNDRPEESKSTLTVPLSEAIDMALGMMDPWARSKCGHLPREARILEARVKELALNISQLTDDYGDLLIVSNGHEVRANGAEAQLTKARKAREDWLYHGDNKRYFGELDDALTPPDQVEGAVTAGAISEALELGQRDAAAVAGHGSRGYEPPPEPAPKARCHSVRDGECSWSGCPQLRDNEPTRSGRHCPLDVNEDDEEPAPKAEVNYDSLPDYDVTHPGDARMLNRDPTPTGLEALEIHIRDWLRDYAHRGDVREVSAKAVQGWLETVRSARRILDAHKTETVALRDKCQRQTLFIERAALSTQPKPPLPPTVSLPRGSLSGDHPPLNQVFTLHSVCRCGIECGSYKAVVLLPGRNRFFAVDECVASEIARLRRLGVETVASCCGHGKRLPDVIVEDDASADLMRSLGYSDYTQPYVMPSSALQADAQRAVDSQEQRKHENVEEWSQKLAADSVAAGESEYALPDEDKMRGEERELLRNARKILADDSTTEGRKGQLLSRLILSPAHGKARGPYVMVHQQYLKQIQEKAKNAKPDVLDKACVRYRKARIEFDVSSVVGDQARLDRAQDELDAAEESLGDAAKAHGAKVDWEDLTKSSPPSDRTSELGRVQLVDGTWLTLPAGIYELNDGQATLKIVNQSVDFKEMREAAINYFVRDVISESTFLLAVKKWAEGEVKGHEDVREQDG